MASALAVCLKIRRSITVPDGFMRTTTACLTLIIALALPALAGAQERIGADKGKLLLTAGFSDVEGAGGGGLVPWAVITGYGTNHSWGANAHYTDVRLRSSTCRPSASQWASLDRFELSATRHKLDVTGTALEGVEVSQDIFGLKVRLAGDAVYGQDSWLPQIAIGAEIKTPWRHRQRRARSSIPRSSAPSTMTASTST